ncbi:MAG: SDR family oxidoreductase [Acidobacteria bacterium]|nr:SDR family oxidoreductase [Acidobacteriota bacterium]
MKVLVTGGTGFLGANLVHHLVGRGDTVRVLKRRRTPPDILTGLPVEFTEGDVTDFDSLLGASRGVEGIYHLAGLVSYWPPRRAWQYRVNVVGAHNVVEAALSNGVRRVVHTSSIAAIGFRTDGKPCDEETSWNWGPQDIHYATTKHLGEQEALKAAARGLEVVVVNPALIFGPRDTSWNAGRMFKLVQEKATVFSPAGSTTTCDVDDVCQGHLAAMERGRSGQRYILGGEHIRYADLFRAVGEVMSKKVEVKVIPYWLAQAVAYANYGLSLLTRREPALTPELLRMGRFARTYTSEKAIRELGYPQTPLRASLEKTYRWYRKHGYLK